MRRNWHPGQHVAIFNPTGGGKSYLVVEGLLRFPVVEHARVLMIDDKGTDPVTRVWGRATDGYPPPRVHRALFGKQRVEPDHWRLTVPDWRWTPQATTRRDPSVQNARTVVADAIQSFYDEAQDPTDEASARDARASVLVIDEAAAMTDRESPSLNLGPILIHVLRKGRYRGLSVVALSQLPVKIPSEVYNQSSHLYLGEMQDARYRERLQEIGGNARAEDLQAAMASLRGHEFLFLGNKGSTKMIVEVNRER